MNKHFYLKLIYSKWTLIFTAVVVVLNLTAALYSGVHHAAFLSVINVANFFIVMYLTANYMNVHMLMSYNKSHEFFMALPVNKKDFIKSDYMFHLLMTLLSIVVIFTYSLANGEFYHLFGMIMITGVNLLIASFYYTTLVQDGFKNINIKVIIYLVPMGFTYMFYFMPLMNLDGAANDFSTIPFWHFTLYTLPYIVLALGILAYVITYFTTQKQSVKNDLI